MENEIDTMTNLMQYLRCMVKQTAKIQTLLNDVNKLVIIFDQSIDWF